MYCKFADFRVRRLDYYSLENLITKVLQFYPLKLNISKIIFSSPSGKMDTDFFTFCLILKRKKNNKNLLWWGSNPQTLGLKSIVVTTTLLMIWLVPMHANIKSLKNVCYMSVHDGCYINRSRFCWFLVQIVEYLSSETYYITL